MFTDSDRTICSVVALAFLILLATGSTGGNTSSSSSTAPDPPSARELARPRVDLKLNSWNKTGFGSIMEIDVTITNMNDRSIKDIEIECKHSAPSGTVIDSNSKTLYEVIGPNAIRRFRNFNMGFIHSQAERSGCEIKDFVLQ